MNKGTSAELLISQRSTSPTSTVDTSVASNRSSGSQRPGGLTPSMGSHGSDRKSEEPVSKEPSLTATSSREQQCRDPEVPPVIRFSSLSPENAAAEISDRGSARIVPVVRPFAVKKSQQTSNAREELDPKRLNTQLLLNEASGTQDGKASVRKQIPPLGKAVGRSDTPTPHTDEIKRRHEAQISFPTHNRQEQMPPTVGRRAGMPQMNGPSQSPPAPTQHVHYRQQHHTNRQDAHGRATSITSSVDVTPTLIARRGQQRNMSSGSDAEMSPAIAPTPLFQRLVTEEVQELKHYTRIIEEQNRRLNEVENITVDLDRKLQKQTKARMDLERTLELRERQWADKFEKLEADRDHWKVVVQKEERMNTRLNDQVARLEQEIHRMLQRKVCACVTRISRAPMWSIILICVRFHSFFSMTTNVVMLRDLCEAYVHTIPAEALHPFPCQLILIRTARLRLLA